MAPVGSVSTLTSPLSLPKAVSAFTTSNTSPAVEISLLPNSTDTVVSDFFLTVIFLCHEAVCVAFSSGMSLRRYSPALYLSSKGTLPIATLLIKIVATGEDMILNCPKEKNVLLQKGKTQGEAMIIPQSSFS